MKLALTDAIVQKLSLDNAPVQGKSAVEWKKTEKPNYLVYDSHRSSPPGFAVRVGARASVYLVEKMVRGKKLKIDVGLAWGKRGGDVIMSLATARSEAVEKIAKAVKHGTNPNRITDEIESSELTFEIVWDRYIADLKGRARPIKKNSLDSINKARDKFEDWESRKVRLITGQEVLDRFDLHAVSKGHRTAAEAMGRWATAAVNNAIQNEAHNAHAERRTPSLTYNPFTILNTKKKYRDNKQLERDYKAKGVRNPLSFSESVGPFLDAAWTYRLENARAADYLILDLLWGLRGDECRSLKWKEDIPVDKLHLERWVDLENKVVFIHDAKNRDDHEFPIGPFALALLKLRKADRRKSVPWLFEAKMPGSRKGLIYVKDGKEVDHTEPENAGGEWQLPSGIPCETGHYGDPSVAMDTVRERAGIKMVRGHDLRRTFGAACEKLGLADRQVKRMLGHSVGGGETLGRYTAPEWKDHMERMVKIEQLILKSAPALHNALRPAKVEALPEKDDPVIQPGPLPRKTRSRRG
jgi:integrase